MLGQALRGFVDEVTGLLGSARKIVFVLIAGAAVAFTATGILSAEDFMTLAGMVFTFYFAKDESEDVVG